MRRQQMAYAIVLAAGGCLLLAGCARRRGYDAFIPPEPLAQQTLEKALAAWKNGSAPGVVQVSGPEVRLVDSQHKPGQKLADFVVLGPTTGDGPRYFAVRLTFAQPAEEIRARYVVFGQDPLWVVRHEDYELVTHWCESMPSSGSKSTASSSR